VTDPAHRLAYHEAAHAIVAQRLGLTVRRVFIDIARDHGFSEISPCCDRDACGLAIALAGMAAEERSPAGEFNLGGARCDLEEAFRRVDAISPPEHDMGERTCLLSSARAHTRCLVDDHWDEIEALAARLMEPPHCVNLSE
jgi:hypothetical protein